MSKFKKAVETAAITSIINPVVGFSALGVLGTFWAINGAIEWFMKPKREFSEKLTENLALPLHLDRIQTALPAERQHPGQLLFRDQVFQNPLNILSSIPENLGRFQNIMLENNSERMRAIDSSMKKESELLKGLYKDQSEELDTLTKCYDAYQEFEKRPEKLIAKYYKKLTKELEKQFEAENTKRAAEREPITKEIEKLQTEITNIKNKYNNPYMGQIQIISDYDKDQIKIKQDKINECTRIADQNKPLTEEEKQAKRDLLQGEKNKDLEKIKAETKKQNDELYSMLQKKSLLLSAYHNDEKLKKFLKEKYEAAQAVNGPAPPFNLEELLTHDECIEAIKEEKKRQKENLGVVSLKGNKKLKPGEENYNGFYHKKTENNQIETIGFVLEDLDEFNMLRILNEAKASNKDKEWTIDLTPPKDADARYERNLLKFMQFAEKIGVKLNINQAALLKISPESRTRISIMKDIQNLAQKEKQLGLNNKELKNSQPHIQELANGVDVNNIPTTTKYLKSFAQFYCRYRNSTQLYQEIGTGIETLKNNFQKSNIKGKESQVLTGLLEKSEEQLSDLRSKDEIKNLSKNFIKQLAKYREVNIEANNLGGQNAIEYKEKFMKKILKEKQMADTPENRAEITKELDELIDVILKKPVGPGNTHRTYADLTNPHDETELNAALQALYDGTRILPPPANNDPGAQGLNNRQP